MKRLKIDFRLKRINIYWYDKDMGGHRYWIISKRGISYWGWLPF